MANSNRRDFLKSAGLSVLPVCMPALVTGMAAPQEPALAPVNFINDGLSLSPAAMLDKLQEINKQTAIVPDFYGQEGTMEALLEKFRQLTGKEKAIYMPTGTMANQLAIMMLSGEDTKVFVQETSHVYRDEADAAQSVHRKRLIPLAPGEPFFTLETLQQALAYYEEGEVFKSGVGVVSIENPVRRCDGQTFPLEEIRRISAFCREKGYRLHLDGARLHLAAAFAGVSIQEYARYFDTVFISLYKCVGAVSGAILCGDKVVIDKMEHQIKIHGGAIYRNWVNSALALHYIDGLEERLQATARQAKELIRQLNQFPELKIVPYTHGSNVCEMEVSKKINNEKLSNVLRARHQIVMRRTVENGKVRLNFNETLLNRKVEHIVAAYRQAIKEVL
ncbi:threonine aldolase family protein [Chitinophaga nivalis]|uniref:Aminotransferase class I/II-fold pyridoxal phosphate-dependent enzyme n=1 Tax=Chitinophaga nivalis TaxID=2991709 RepID=A0ABT3IS24_9BACT|nr:aminotransferase class I/II-fold pyridoxal phosphate-dependent enzyme [Chitinophaga nivalis]MCW3463530.1 aminotransferase class I/II-fold pyridoxal phosphate-dependent enzyme [Chitinophaga nivalis]MCW3486780.1 aminotransferase class I/II-fold pyridoxal phosphate-dependent enzyme [Chitinophaga nivalis]